jgi:hypothetical protein
LVLECSSWTSNHSRICIDVFHHNGPRTDPCATSNYDSWEDYSASTNEHLIFNDHSAGENCTWPNERSGANNTVMINSRASVNYSVLAKSNTILQNRASKHLRRCVDFGLSSDVHNWMDHTTKLVSKGLISRDNLASSHQ